MRKLFAAVVLTTSLLSACVQPGCEQDDFVSSEFECDD